MSKGEFDGPNLSGCVEPWPSPDDVCSGTQGSEVATKLRFTAKELDVGRLHVDRVGPEATECEFGVLGGPGERQTLEQGCEPGFVDHRHGGPTVSDVLLVPLTAR